MFETYTIDNEDSDILKGNFILCVNIYIYTYVYIKFSWSSIVS